MVNTIYLLSFVETPREFIIAFMLHLEKNTFKVFSENVAFREKYFQGVQ